MTPAALGAISTAAIESSLYGYKFVYIAIWPFCFLCAGLVVFLRSVSEELTGHVESNLEGQETIEKGREI